MTYYYFGSFNPFHNGHLKVVEELCKRDVNVEIVPAAISLNKDLKPVKNRAEIINNSIKHLSNAKVNLVEESMQNIGMATYTSYVLCLLSEDFPDNGYFKIVITDELLKDLPNWHNYHYLQGFNYCVLKRFNDVKSIKYDVNVEIIEGFTPLNISSTLIRDNVKNGIDINDLVSPLNVDLIKKLYK